MDLDMEPPKYQEFFNPILDALKELGGSATVQELDEKVAEVMKLSAEMTDYTKPGERVPVVRYRLTWARSYLKKVGLVDNSSRGVWSLTAVGKATSYVDPKEVRRKVAAMRKAVVPEDDESDGLGEDEDYDWKVHLLDELRAMKPDAFERLCQRILRESGFIQVEVTGRSGDGGIDGHGIVRLAGLLSFPVIFQAKRYTNTVSPSEVRAFRGAMVGRADKGLFITTGTFTTSARAEATRDGAPPIDLVDGDDLAEKLKELKLGISTKMVENVEVDADWFKQI